MLEITDTTTIRMLREYSEQNNIDLGKARLRQDIIDIVLAAQGGVKQPEKPPENKSENGVIAIKRVLFASRALMTGDDVEAVHAALNEQGLSAGADIEQGIYGAKTAYAVRRFQAMKGLIVDGKVGKFTARSLGFEWEE